MWRRLTLRASAARAWTVVGAGVIVVMLPSSAFAQGAIAGQVTDTTGATLPGVTIAATSEALIEGTRTGLSDAQGRYAIEALRPGTYQVTFALPGFTTVVRNGIELPSDFTAVVSVQMQLGALEETITVSGRSPVVDVQRTTGRAVLSRETLDALPTGRGWAQAAIVVPGTIVSKPDVAGAQAMQQTYLRIHGSTETDSSPWIDGVRANCTFTQANIPCNYVDHGAFQEIVYQTGGGAADTQAGGLAMNLIPREGGNRFSGSALALYSNTRLSSQNWNEGLGARGLTLPGRLDRLFDDSVSIGGPVKRDRLWFFSANRVWGVDRVIPNTLDEFGNQGIDDNILESYLLRLTYQLSPKNKIGMFYNRLPRWRGHQNLTPGTDPKASVVNDTFAPYFAQVKWTSTLTSRLLLDVGVLQNVHNFTRGYNPLVLPTDIAKVDTLLNRRWNAAQNVWINFMNTTHSVASLSYVTGTHTLKTGMQFTRGRNWQRYFSNGDLVQRYQNGQPFEVQVSNTPVSWLANLDADLGFFVQDSWRVSRLTVNPGLRFDYLHGSLPAHTSPAGRFVPARNVPAIPNLPRGVIGRPASAWRTTFLETQRRPSSSTLASL